MGTLRPNNLRSILCEGSDLDQYVQFSSQAEKEAFQNVSCSLAPQQLINTQQVLLQNLDARKVLSEVRLSTHNNKSNFRLIKLEGCLTKLVNASEQCAYSTCSDKDTAVIIQSEGSILAWGKAKQ